METLKVGVPGAWGELIPSLQHTAYADAILSNQYEALVRIGSGGTIAPLAAKEWKIEDNYKTFTFTIDTSRRFSNGEYLKAQDFKDSWEHALSLIPKSSNNSLQDVLYRVEGFENYNKTKVISGLIVKDDKTFIIRFKEPFRTALPNLTGSRMAVFKKDGEKYLGTGPYQFTKTEENKAYMVKNTYSTEQADFQNVTYEVVSPEEAEKALNQEKIHLFIFAEKTELDDCVNKTGKISCFLGSESRHSTLIVNGMKNRFFSNSEYRKAFQALMYDRFSEKNVPAHLRQTFVIDPQIYLPLQKGRLDDTESQKIIDEGKKFIPSLLAATKKKPLKVYTGKTSEWLVDYIRSKGVTLTKDSGVKESKDIIEMYYKNFESDILASGLGVFSGDPDGIYHALGKDGSITSPMSLRSNLSALLEKGRAILDPEKIDGAYKLVSKAALDEVPFIHLGFLKTRIAYRSDLVGVKKDIKYRDDDRLITFSPL